MGFLTNIVLFFTVAVSSFVSLFVHPTVSATSTAQTAIEVTSNGQVSQSVQMPSDHGSNQPTVSSVVSENTNNSVIQQGSIAIGPGVPTDVPGATSTPMIPGATLPLTDFSLTNTGTSAVTINGITVQQTGTANSNAFSGASLQDDAGATISTFVTLGSIQSLVNAQAVVGGTFTLAPGQTKDLTIMGSAAAATDPGNAGKTAGLSIIKINTSASISGSLPIIGRVILIHYTAANPNL